MAGLDDLKGLFVPKWFYESTKSNAADIASELHTYVS